MRKRIALILTALIVICMPILSGCSEEDLQLAATILQFVFNNNTETEASPETQNSWGEDGTEPGAVIDIGQKETQAAKPQPQTTKAQETKPAETKPQKTEPAETQVETAAPIIEETVQFESSAPEEPEPGIWVQENGEYTAMEDVALYIATYNHLPSNYITKDEAEALGWVNSKGNLWKVAPGKCIGGDRFGNYEGQLPKKKGRKYTECDVNYTGGYRQAERIIFSNDGLVYYTADHYETFTLLYGEE